MRRFLQILVTICLGVVAFAAVPQDDNTRRNNNKSQTQNPKSQTVKAQPKAITVEDETIPDSLLHPRWKIQKTAPVLTADLDSSALD